MLPLIYFYCDPHRDMLTENGQMDEIFSIDIFKWVIPLISSR